MNDTVLLIFGVTNKGIKFRPSDWIERFCGVMAPYGSNYQSSDNIVDSRHGLRYSDLVFPSTHNGERVVMALMSLNEVEPLAWEFVLNFTIENDLKTLELSRSKVMSNGSKLNPD